VSWEHCSNNQVDQLSCAIVTASLHSNKAQNTHLASVHSAVCGRYLLCTYLNSMCAINIVVKYPVTINQLEPVKLLQKN
jgi:hypothetical protein